jgi:hypothetical protein
MLLLFWNGAESEEPPIESDFPQVFLSHRNRIVNQ